MARETSSFAPAWSWTLKVEANGPSLTSPKVMLPRARRETIRPVSPSRAYFMQHYLIAIVYMGHVGSPRRNSSTWLTNSCLAQRYHHPTSKKIRVVGELYATT